jgi:hypothetical protein
MSDRRARIFEHTSLGPQVRAKECGLPWAVGEFDIALQLQRVTENGRVSFIGTAARTARQFLMASATLNPEQSLRANNRFFQMVKSFMAGQPISGTAYEGDSTNAKVFLQLNDSVDKTGVALFFAQTSMHDRESYSKIPVFIRLAAVKLDDRKTIERMFWRHGYR